MPERITPPYVVEPDLQNEPLKTAEQAISDAYSLSLVNQTFWSYETWRSMNCDRRWSTHDSLFFGFVIPRVWDGTNIPRAAFTQQIVFDQVEAALPAIVQAIFGIGPDWFQVQGEPGVDPQEARQLQDSLSYILEHPKDEVGSNAIAEFKTAIKSTLLYGNGGVCVEYSPILKRPTVNWVDIRDIYVDPGLSCHNIDESRSVIRRKYMTIDEVLQLGEDKRMRIPSKGELYYMATNAPQAYADQTKRIQEGLRGVYYSPGFSDYLPLPSDQKLEVLIYYSKSRIIWVLNKQWVAYNGPNPFGFIPFAFAPCYSVVSRFYGQSIADAQEMNQRYTEALLNAHLDELTMLLHPPRVMKRSALLTPNQQKWGPGRVFNAENKDDVSLLQVNNSTVNVFDDIQYIAMVAEKRTGINAMGQGSVPQPSNANRTLGGLQMQASGSSTRLAELVSNIEQFLLVPVLYKLYKILQTYSYPGQTMAASNSSGETYHVDSSLAQKKVRFRMLASSRMLTRDKLMSIVPFWMQALTQGSLLEQLSKSGKTIDFDVFMQMLQDATGISHLYQLVRPMNQQEQQQAQQPPPQAQVVMQKAQLDSDTRKQIMQMKIQGDQQSEQTKKQPNPWELQAKQQEMQMEAQQKQQEMQADAEAQKQKLQQDAIVNMLHLHAKQQEHQMDLKKKQADIQVAVQGSENTRQQGMLDHVMKMQQMAQQLEMQKQQQQVQAQAPAASGGVQAPSAKPISGEGRPDRPKRKAQLRHKLK